MKRTIVLFQIIIIFLLCIIKVYAANVLDISDDDQLLISNKVGFVSDKFVRSKNDKLVIIVQDLHKDKQTQSNIKNIISEINENYGFETIFIEGLYNKPVWNKENSEKTADLLFDNLYLSGAEYFCLNNNCLDKILPLDESQSYKNNIQRLAYLTILESEINKSIAINDKVINTAKKQIFSKQNKKIDTLINKYHNGEISQKKFYSSIKKYLNKKDIENMSNIKIYYEYSYIKDLNFKKLNKEFSDLINDFKHILPYKDYIELSKKLSNKNDFLPEIEQLSIKYDINLNKYKEIEKYIALNKLEHSLNSFNFIDEERQLLRELKIKYSKNKNERLLIVLNDLYSYYKDFLNNKLTEYGYNYLSDFGVDNFMNLWANVLSDKNIYELKEFYKYFNEYNQTNIYRSEIFANKILDLKQNINGNIIAIMGGFHTRQVAEYLKYKNVSYVVITPTLNGSFGKKQDYLYKQNILRSVDLKYNAIPSESVLNDKEKQEKAIHHCLDTREETDYDRSALNQGIMASQWINTLNIKGDKNIKITSAPGLIVGTVVSGDIKQKLQNYTNIFNSRHGNIIQVSNEDSLHLTIYNPTAKKPQKVSDITEIFKNKDFIKKIFTALGINENDIKNKDIILTDEDREIVYDIIELEIKDILNSFYKKGFKFPQWEIDGLAAFTNGVDVAKTILVFHARPKNDEDLKSLSDIQQACYKRLGFTDYPIFNGHITLGRFAANDFSSEEEKEEFLKTIKEIDDDIKKNLTSPKYTLNIRPVISRLHLKDSKTEKHKSKIKISNPIYIFTNILRNDLINLFDRIKTFVSQKFPTLFDNEQKIPDIDSQQIKDMLEQFSHFYRNNDFEQNITTKMAENLINEINEQARQSSNYLGTLEKLINEMNKQLSSTHQNFELKLFKSNNSIKIIVVNTKDITERHNISEVFTFSGEKLKKQTLEEKLDIYDNMSKEDFIRKFKISEQEYEEVKNIIKSNDSIKAIVFLQKTNNINIAYYIFFNFNNNMEFIKEVVNKEYIDIKIRLYAYILANINNINVSKETMKNLLDNTVLLIKNEMIVSQNGESIQNFSSFLENELFRNEIFVSYHAAIILHLQSVFPEKQISKETFAKLLEAGIDKNYNGSGDSRFIYGEEHIWKNKRFANISAHEIGYNFLYDLHIDINKIGFYEIMNFVEVVHEFYAQNTAHIFINGNGFGDGQISQQCRTHFHGLTKQYESANRYDGNYQYNFNNRSQHLGGYSLLYMLNDLLDLSDNKNAVNLSKAIENITLKYVNKIQNVDKYIVYDYVIELLKEYGKIAGYDVSNTIKYLQDNRPLTEYDDVWLFPKLDQIPSQYQPIPKVVDFRESHKDAKKESLLTIFDKDRSIKYDNLNANLYLNLLTAS